MTTTPDDRGERLLNAVERILARPEQIEQKVDALRAKERARQEDLPALLRERVAQQLIRQYAMSTGIGGGLSGLPALLPGLGTAAAVIGGGLADMTLCLKYEIEMILGLTYLFGHDIRSQEERARAMLLAGVSTFQEFAGRNALLDLALVEGEALWKYTPRQVAKLLATIFLRLAISMATRRLVRAIPLAGLVVSFSANRMLTQKVGQRALAELHQRPAGTGPTPSAGAADAPPAADVGGDASGTAEVVDAQVIEPGEDAPAGDGGQGRG